MHKFIHSGGVEEQFDALTDTLTHLKTACKYAACCLRQVQRTASTKGQAQALVLPLHCAFLYVWYEDNTVSDQTVSFTRVQVNRIPTISSPPAGSSHNYLPFPVECVTNYMS
jgi:hypothetical protein